jgi:hypothetical protein
MILDDALDWGSLCKYFLKASLLGTAAFNLVETGQVKRMNGGSAGASVRQVKPLP